MPSGLFHLSSVRLEGLDSNCHHSLAAAAQPETINMAGGSRLQFVPDLSSRCSSLASWWGQMLKNEHEANAAKICGLTLFVLIFNMRLWVIVEVRVKGQIIFKLFLEKANTTNNIISRRHFFGNGTYGLSLSFLIDCLTVTCSLKILYSG